MTRSDTNPSTPPPEDIIAIGIQGGKTAVRTLLALLSGMMLAAFVAGVLS